jgi:hypothetical protein
MHILANNGKLVFLSLFFATCLLLIILPPVFRFLFAIDIPWYVILVVWITGYPFKILLREMISPFRNRLEASIRRGLKSRQTSYLLDSGNNPNPSRVERDK